MILKRDGKRDQFGTDEDAPTDAKRKKGRLWVFSADIMVITHHPVSPPMPLDVDNGLPGIKLWFGSASVNDIGFICHMDTCTAMNTGNLRVHQWLTTKHPHIVAKYIQYDDIHPFEPLQLHCTVNDLAKTEPMHGKLTAIVRYWLRHNQNGKQVVLSFGLGTSAEVNSIVCIPTIKAWNIVFDFYSNKLIAKGINTTFPFISTFPFIFESTKHGLPPGVSFSDVDFIQPRQGSMEHATVLLTNITGDIGTQVSAKPDHATPSKSSIVTQTDTNGYVRLNADVSHIL